MTIGEKIRRIRQQTGMTQAALAGEKITRNMLSQIENDLANPSLDTLLYLAERLQISPAYFLSDEDDEFQYRKNARIGEIRTLLSNRNFSACIDRCVELADRGDHEISLILAECYLYVGAEYFHDGNAAGAYDALTQSLIYAGQTVYHTWGIKAAARILLELLETLEDPSVLPNPTKILPESPFSPTYFYCCGLTLISVGEFSAVQLLIDSPMLEDKHRAHLSAKMRMRSGEDPQQIIEILRRLNLLDIDEIMRAQIQNDLIDLYNRIGDFENAYRLQAVQNHKS